MTCVVTLGMILSYLVIRRKGETMKTKIAVTVEAEIVRRLDQAAAKLETSRSALLERFVQDSLEEEEPVIAKLVTPEARKRWCELMKYPGADRMFLDSVGPRISKDERKLMMAIVTGPASMIHSVSAVKGKA